MPSLRPGFGPYSFAARQAGTLPDLLGIVVDALGDGSIDLSMQIQSRHLAPNGYLHAASVIALADTQRATAASRICRTARAGS